MDESASHTAEAHDAPADEPVVEADAWDATELQHAPIADTASHDDETRDVPEATEHVAVDELADAEAALGDTQTLVAPDAELADAERAEAEHAGGEQQVLTEHAAVHDQHDQHAQIDGDAPAQDLKRAVGRRHAVC